MLDHTSQAPGIAQPRLPSENLWYPPLASLRPLALWVFPRVSSEHIELQFDNKQDTGMREKEVKTNSLSIKHLKQATNITANLC